MVAAAERAAVLHWLRQVNPSAPLVEVIRAAVALATAEWRAPRRTFPDRQLNQHNQKGSYALLFLFRGQNGPASRDIIGVLLVACGVAVHGEAMLAAVGAVLLVWVGVAALSTQRVRRQAQVTSGRMS